MTDITKALLENSAVQRRRRRILSAALALLSVVTAGAVFWQLRQTGISATSDAVCGLEEHVHTENCYEIRNICGLEAGQVEVPGHTHGPECYRLFSSLACQKEAHAHDEACYAEERVLTCALEEHTHGEGCYDGAGTLICGREEHVHAENCYTLERRLTCTLEPHAHDESCWQETKVLTCNQEETAPVLHVHTDACWERTLTCTVPEHTHDEICVPDLTADVETTEMLRQNASNPGTGVWNTDLLAVARAQLGYRESTRNFTVDDNGTHHGYTRYGESYGDPYGPWNGMFVAYCLRYSGVPEYVAPQRAGITAMLTACTGSMWLRQENAEAAQPGDIVFFDGMVGVVSQNGTELQVICGDNMESVALISVHAENVLSWISISDAYSTYTESVNDSAAGDNAAESDAYADSLSPNSNSGQTGEEAKASNKTGSLENITVEADDSDSENTNQNAEDTTPVDLAANEYIDSTTKLYKRISDGNYRELKPDEIITEGDYVRLKLDYTIPKVRNASRQAFYSPIPAGLSVSTSATGDLFNEQGQKAGTYEIANQKIVFHYDEDFWNSHGPIEGTFYLEGTVGKSGSGDQEKINFPGFGDIVIQKKPTDLSVGKKYLSARADADGNLIYNYQVTYSSTNGTGTGNLTLKDSLNENTNSGSTYRPVYATYNHDFQIRKGGVALSPKDYTFTLYETDPQYPYFTYEVPPLNAGESYVVTYSVTIPPESFADSAGSGSGRLYNTARGLQGDTELCKKTDWATYGQRVTKSSEYNPNTGRITWKIIVNNPLGQMNYGLAGFRLRDPLPDGLTIVGNVELRANDAAGQRLLPPISAEEFIQNGFTFPASLPTYKNYALVFETEVPPSDGNQSIANTAFLERDNVTFQGGATANITAGQWGITKQSLGDIQSGVAHWSIYVVNSTGAATFSLLDVIADGVEGSNSFVGTHYAIASELQRSIANNLELLMVDGTTLDYTALSEISYYTSADGTGDTVDPSDTATHVRSFRLTFKANGLNVKSISLRDYPTHTSVDGVQLGHSLTFANQARMNTGVVSTSSVTYHNPGKLEKLVSLDGTNFEKYLPVQYAENITLTYRLELHTNQNQVENLTLTDQLPEGGKFVSGSTQLFVDEVLSGNVSVTQQGQQLNFTVSDYGNDGNPHKLYILYRMSITPGTDGRWNDLSLKSLDYNNAVTWNEESSSVKTKVQRDVPALKKEEKLIDLGDDDPKTQVCYTVYINLEQKRYGKDELVLEDRLVLPEGVSLDSLSPVVNTADIKLYYYTFDSIKNQIVLDDSNLVSTDLYRRIPSTDCLLKIGVPDATALVLQYVCTFTPPVDKVTISNQIAMNGESVSSKTDGVTLMGHNGIVTTAYFGLHKVDSQSRHPLPGAVFRIDVYDNVNSQWTEAMVLDDSQKTFNGTFHVGISQGAVTGSLQVDKLYRIVETTSPAGYILDETPHYVLFYSSSPENGFLAATGEHERFTCDGLTLAKDQVTFGYRRQILNMEIENEPAELKIQKFWMDADNRLLSESEIPTAQPISFILYCRLDGQTKEQAKNVLTATLGPDNNWSVTYRFGTGNDLPAADENGNLYYYFVEEKELQSNWLVTYSNNNGIKTGTITIQNRVYSYQLPETGGMGTAAIYGIGFGMIAISSGGWIYKKRRVKK